MTATTDLHTAAIEDRAAIWASSDPAHWCLRDRVRTEAFLRAIAMTVQPGDTVVEPGAGSGILSVAAAAAGAARVFSIEVDPFLAKWLPQTAAANGVADRITVVEGDAQVADLPRAADVVVAELIDTGLIDERQVPVLNAFHAQGVIGPRTRIIPARYTTWVELVELDDRFYGHRIAAPIHDWPVFHHAQHGWHPVAVRPLTERVAVASIDFSRPVDPHVDRRLATTAISDGTVNALRITGTAHLGLGLELGATNAINGDKILRLDTHADAHHGETIVGRLAFEMGGGLRSVHWSWEG